MQDSKTSLDERVSNNTYFLGLVKEGPFTAYPDKSRKMGLRFNDIEGLFFVVAIALYQQSFVAAADDADKFTLTLLSNYDEARCLDGNVVHETDN